MVSADTLTINKGSDSSFEIDWNGPDGANIDLTGASVAIYDASAELAGLLVAAISDAANGLITVTLTWGAAIPEGRRTSFRVLVTQAGVRTTSPAIWVNVQ